MIPFVQSSRMSSRESLAMAFSASQIDISTSASKKVRAAKVHGSCGASCCMAIQVRQRRKIFIAFKIGACARYHARPQAVSCWPEQAFAIALKECDFVPVKQRTQLLLG